LIDETEKVPAIWVQTHEKVFTNPFSKWLLVGYIRYWSSFGAIPIRKNKLISDMKTSLFLEGRMADSVFEEKTETKHYNYLVLDTVIYL
jgi:hypothetical protein